MPQSSAPLVGVNLSDVDWRDSFGDEAGVLGDLNGTAYRVTLPTNSDVAQVGSATQRSIARVAGFVHRIPAGETEPLTIPAASDTARTDIIALRYDPAFTGAPGPVRLVRVAGTSSGIPSYDDSAPGVEDLPLWAITRQPGQALSQATIRQLFTRLAPMLELPTAAPLPLSSPLGTVVRQGSNQFRRQLGGGGMPVWADLTPPVVNLTINTADFEDWGFGYRRLCYWREARTMHAAGAVRLLKSTPPNGVRTIATLPADATLPTNGRPAGTVVGDGISTARVRILTDGRIQLENATFNVTLGPGVLIPVKLVFPLG